MRTFRIQLEMTIECGDLDLMSLGRLLAHFAGSRCAGMAVRHVAVNGLLFDGCGLVATSAEQTLGRETHPPGGDHHLGGDPDLVPRPPAAVVAHDHESLPGHDGSVADGDTKRNMAEQQEL